MTPACSSTLVSGSGVVISMAGTVVSGSGVVISMAGTLSHLDVNLQALDTALAKYLRVFPSCFRIVLDIAHTFKAMGALKVTMANTCSSMPRMILRNGTQSPASAIKYIDSSLPSQRVPARRLKKEPSCKHRAARSRQWLLRKSPGQQDIGTCHQDAGTCHYNFGHRNRVL